MRPARRHLAGWNGRDRVSRLRGGRGDLLGTRGRSLLCEPLEDRRLLTVFTVNSLWDVVAADGLVTLREALEAANTNAPVYDAPAGSATETDTIRFDPELFLDGEDPPPGITLGGTQLTIADDVDIEGPGAELLSINANQQSRVLYVNSGVTANLGGITIAGGKAPSSSDLGGGVYNAGKLSITDSVISGNSAAYGGGIWGSGAAAELAIANSTISGNSATRDGGGGSVNIGKLTITNSTVSGNSAGLRSGGIAASGANISIGNSAISGNVAGTDGGGMSVAGTVKITDSIVVGNSAGGNGGGVYASGTVSVSGSSVVDNSAGSYGGGVYNNGGILTLAHSVVADNLASSYGGGIYSTGTSSKLTVTDSIISGNSATGRGGGIDGYTTSATLTITNSTISGNSATGASGFGGGIHCSGTTTITNSTVAGNTAKYGGGISRSGGTVTFRNSIVALNEGSSSPDYYGPLASGSDYNLIGVWTQTGNPGAHSFWGTAAAPLDPLLTAVLEQTGLATYYRPRSGSPAIDAGSNALAVDPAGNPLVTDMLGSPRIHGSAVDIGAVEQTDSPQLVIGPAFEVEVLEGGSTAVDVWLTAAPVAPVTVTIGKRPGGSDDLSADPLTLVFDETNWDQPQSLSLLATEDEDRDNNDQAVFTFAGEGMHTIAARASVVDNDAQLYVVDSLEDVVAPDGMLTLREALQAANTNTAADDAPEGCEGLPDRITFDPELFLNGSDPVARTLTLGGAEPMISDDLDIVGPGAGLLSIDAAGLSRVFYVNAGVTASLTGLTLTGGAALQGGGVFNRGKLTIANSILTRNQATDTTSGYGGGIYSTTATAEVTITSSTLAGNWARSGGGGIYVDGGTLTLFNSIVAANGPNSIDYNKGSLSPASGYNLIGGTPGFAESPAPGSDGVWGTSDDILGDVHLRADSPAIDAGSNELAVDSHGDPLVTDADGLPRLGNGTVDIGAYEYNSAHVHAATDQYTNLAADQTHVLDVLVNDMYPAGATVTVGIVEAPHRGTAVVDPDGTVSYSSYYSFTGSDSFSYRMIVNGQPSNTAEVRLQLVGTGPIPISTVLDELNGQYAPGDLSLREALLLAAVNADQNVITFVLEPDDTRVVLQQGQLVIDSPIEIQGPGAGLLAIDADGRSRVFYVNSGVTATVSGLSITGGLLSSSEEKGGGIYNSGTLTITDSTISGNSATGSNSYGGGIYSAGTLTITSSTASGNLARGYGGGISGSGTMTITDSTISGNTGTSQGGGICAKSGGTLTIDASTVSGNSSAQGGGIYTYSTTTLTASDAIIAHNSATNGGGLYIDSSGTSTIRHCMISENSASARGGGMNKAGNGALTITDSTLWGNSTAYYGGGLYFSRGVVTIINTTISGNTATGTDEGGQGGAIQGATELILINSTVVGNSAFRGCGGIAAQALFTVKNSIIAGNSAAFLPDVSDPMTAESGYNLIGVWDQGTPPGENSVWGTAGAPLDPLLTAVSSGDGLARYYRPQPGSPAIDAGSNDLALAPDGSPLALDQVGQPRVSGDAVDIGSVELQPAPELAVTPTPAVEIGEGQATTIQVWLTAEPSSPVTVTIDRLAGASTDITCDTSTLVFDATNWNIPQSVVVSAAEDDNRANDSAAFALAAEGMETVCVLVWAVDNDPQTYVVDSPADVVEVDGLLTLREAIGAANSNTAVGDAPEGCEGATDVITFSPSLAGRSIVLSGTELLITDDLDIQGPQANLLSIDGNNQSRVLRIDGIVNVAISGLTITRGYAKRTGSSAEVDGDGGGIRIEQATVTITDCTISGNVADSAGGGAHVRRGTLTVTNCTISGNSTSVGGGLCNADAVLTVAHSTVTGNSASGTGGGVKNSDGLIIIESSGIWGNSAGSNGGGIYVSYLQSAYIVNSAIHGNSAGQDGGGVYNDRGNLTVTNSTIAGNRAVGKGGGILSRISVQNPQTGEWEDAPYQLTCTNSLVAINAAASDANVYGELTAASGFNLIGTDPGFVHNPGPGADGTWGTADDVTGDLHLRANSPAINAGSNALAVDAAGQPLVSDLDGLPRVIYGTVDIGAYEFCLPGDTDLDAVVNEVDASILAAHWLLQTGVSWAQGDFTGDGRVDDLDASILAANWQAGVPAQAAGAGGRWAGAEGQTSGQESDPRFIGPRPKVAAGLAPQQRVPLQSSPARQASSPSAEAPQQAASVPRAAQPLLLETPLSRELVTARDAALAQSYRRSETFYGPLAWAYELEQARRPKRPLQDLLTHERAVDLLLATEGLA